MEAFFPSSFSPFSLFFLLGCLFPLTTILPPFSNFDSNSLSVTLHPDADAPMRGCRGYVMRNVHVHACVNASAYASASASASSSAIIYRPPPSPPFRYHYHYPGQSPPGGFRSLGCHSKVVVYTAVVYHTDSSFTSF